MSGPYCVYDEYGNRYEVIRTLHGPREGEAQVRDMDGHKQWVDLDRFFDTPPVLVGDEEDDDE